MANQIVRNESVTVGTSSVSISSQVAVGQRYAISITNVSTGGQVITLSWQTPAQVNQGVVLTPNGNWSESVDSAFIPLNTEIFAIASAAGAQVAIQERTLV